MGFVQVPVMSGHEIQTPQLPVGIRIGGTVMLVGLLAIVSTLTSSYSRPAFTAVHGVILALACVGVIAGLVVCANSHSAGRNVTLNRDLAEHVDVKNADLAAQHGQLSLRLEQLTTQVEASNDVLRQLSAAPTVRLEEVRRELHHQLERVSRESIRELAEHVDKTIEKGLRDRLAGLAGELSSHVRIAHQEGAQHLAKNVEALRKAFDESQAQLVRDAFDAGVYIGRTATMPDDESVPATIGVSDDATLDPRYLADMARSVELGREMERRKHEGSAD
jgi:hypothetical protein